MRRITKKYDVVVVGGGMSGVCAALASARGGCKTALVQNRPVLGGNASSEVRVNINGAARHGEKGRENLHETGIIREIELAVKNVNPEHSFNIFDMTVWEKCNFQENLDLYLNTHFCSAVTENNVIKSIKAIQCTSETEFVYEADIFVDTTGDASVAFESGAEWTIGREAKSTYNEDHAPEKANKYTMGSTVMFTTKDVGHETVFKRPEWAYEFTKEQMANRRINELNHGYWWVEIGGDDEFDVIGDSEAIRDELYKWAFGVFDYIKNSGEYPEAKNLAIDWVCSVPGRRESRRIIGDYVLNENDVFEGKRFEDTIAYGGWSMDDHSIGGIRAKVKDQGGTHWHQLKEPIYTIPYRSIYSKNIENLYVGGRAISASHMAMSSTRVIATCAVIGEAIGTAAVIAIKENLSPREVGSKRIKYLQQTLIKNDCYLPDIINEDKNDLAKKSKITASSQVGEGLAVKVINGVDRNVKEDINMWISESLENCEQWINLEFEKACEISEIRIKFDPNLTRMSNTSLAPKTVEKQLKTMPNELVKDFEVHLLNGTETVKVFSEIENIYRLRTFNFYKTKVSDVKIVVKSSYSNESARIFEVRVM